MCRKRRRESSYNVVSRSVRDTINIKGVCSTTYEVCAAVHHWLLRRPSYERNWVFSCLCSSSITLERAKLGALVVNAHVDGQAYYRRFVQFAQLTNESMISEPDVRRALKRLLPGHIVLSKGTGCRSIGLLKSGQSTDLSAEASLAHPSGELIRHDCATVSGTSGGAIIDIDVKEPKSLGINISSELGTSVPGFDAYKQTSLNRNVAICWEGPLLQCFKSMVLPNVVRSATYPEVTRS